MKFYDMFFEVLLRKKMPPFSTTIFHFSFFVAIYESILSTMPTNIFIRHEFVICQVQKVPQITCSRYIAQFVIKKTVSSYQLIWVPNFLVIYNIQNSKENISLMNYSKKSVWITYICELNHLISPHILLSSSTFLLSLLSDFGWR